MMDIDYRAYPQFDYLCDGCGKAFGEYHERCISIAYYYFHPECAIKLAKRIIRRAEDILDEDR